MILLAPVSEETGGGGAGGNGSGSDKPGGGEQPAGLTEDKVNELINKAIGGRFRAFEEKQAKATEASNAKLLETIGSTLEEKLSGFKPTDEGKDGKGKPATTDLSQNPDFRALKKQNEEITRQLEAEKLEKQKANTKARNEALHRKVESELAALGITDPRSARLILQGDDVVSYEDDDSDNVVFRDEEGGALPLKKGLESWAKSAVGKRFLPPSGANGSGERSSGGSKKQQNGSGTLPSTSEIGEALGRELGITLT